MDKSTKKCMDKAKFVHLVKKRYRGFSIEEANLIVDRVSKGNDDSLKEMKTPLFVKLMKKEVDMYLTQKEEEQQERLQKEKTEKRITQLTCTFCYRMFLNKNACDRHIKVKHSEKKDAVEESHFKKNVAGFDKKCPHCKRCFKYEFSREDHIQRFHSDIDEEEDATEHRCNVCEKLFNHRISLKRHMLLHSEEPVQFSCEYCEVKFTREDNLQKHKQRIHMRVNLNLGLLRKEFKDTFKCKICSVDFGQDRLKFESHLILKTCQRKDEEVLQVDDEGRLQCEQCDRSYADVDSLSRHVAWKHRGATNFECSKCKAIFKLKSSLSRHMRQEHG